MLQWMPLVVQSVLVRKRFILFTEEAKKSFLPVRKRLSMQRKRELSSSSSITLLKFSATKMSS